MFELLLKNLPNRVETNFRYNAEFLVLVQSQPTNARTCNSKTIVLRLVTSSDGLPIFQKSDSDCQKPHIEMSLNVKHNSINFRDTFKPTANIT